MILQSYLRSSVTLTVLLPLRKENPLDIGHAESAELVTEFTEHSDTNQATQNGAKQKDPVAQDLPKHLQQMYEDNISDLSANLK